MPPLVKIYNFKLYKGTISFAFQCFNSLFLIVQASLNKLMETLGQSEPYFVKCIRSNAEKVQQESALRVSLVAAKENEVKLLIFVSLPPDFCVSASSTI